jgi:CRISPR-associated endonuclease/helicase Cas3
MNESQIHTLLARYWGKAHPDVTGGPDHHTVLGHSLDVAACAFVLIDRHPVLRRQLGSGMAIDPDAVAITYAAVCALHDIGKLDTRFQRKAPRVADVLRPASTGVLEVRYDHGTEGFRQVEDDEATASLLDQLLGSSALSLLRAVCGHHGALPSPDAPDPSRARVGRMLRAEDAAARRAFVQIVVAFFVSRGAQLPWPHPADGALVQRLAGLCAIADWLGSNVEHFRYATGPVQIAAYWESACKRAVDACDLAGLLRAPAHPAQFGALFPNYTPRDVQILTESLHLQQPALVIVEAEMGKGKTEAALSLAARLLACGFGDGVTVALPTMATSNAMFDRVHEVAPRLFAGDDVQLALAHGRASREPRFQRLRQKSLKAHDPDAPEASVMCARWLLNKKRILLAQVGVGTIDQALQAALVVRHQFVRMFGLSRNVVIIDEVHAYDAYMEVLLEHLLRWLGALDVPVILLSATLPSERRVALSRAFCGDDDGTSTADDVDCARARPYPLVSVTTREKMETHATPPTQTPSRRMVTLERWTGAPDDPHHVEQVALRLVEAARNGARVVWIRNTVREAQRAFGVVATRAQGVEHTLFHARFRACDRSEVERAVLKNFGKDAAPGGRVLIATQVVEQSLDLDFDELHTDLAPIDLLFQRAGRLHRHDRVRPAGFEARRLIVHVPTDADIVALRFGPSRYVYDAGTLWLAHRALRARTALYLPDDIRALVEETYHPASRAALLPLGGPALVAAEEERRVELIARRTKARQCCIPPTSADPDGGPALPDDDDAIQAFTRDGASATLLPFFWDGEEARALDQAADTAPWHLDLGASDAWLLAGHLLDQTLSLPARSDVEGLIAGRQGAAWEEWRKRFTRFADDGGLGKRVVPLPLDRDRDTHRGWLRVGGRRRRVLYTKTLGLLMPSERGEEQQR